MRQVLAGLSVAVALACGVASAQIPRPEPFPAAPLGEGYTMGDRLRGSSTYAGQYQPTQSDFFPGSGRRYHAYPYYKVPVCYQAPVTPPTRKARVILFKPIR